MHKFCKCGGKLEKTKDEPESFTFTCSLCGKESRQRKRLPRKQHSVLLRVTQEEKEYIISHLKLLPREAMGEMIIRKLEVQ